MRPLDAIARGVHEEVSTVPWNETHAKHRAYCYCVARTINSAYELGQSITDAADRLIVWWQVDNKMPGRKGRAFVDPLVADRCDRLVIAGIRGLASYEQ